MLAKNIGTRESNKRLALGIFMFAISITIFVLLIAYRVDRIWRVILFLPLLAAALGLFQAKAKT